MQKDGGLESFQVGENMAIWGKWCAQRAWKFRTLFPLAVPLLGVGTPLPHTGCQKCAIGRIKETLGEVRFSNILETHLSQAPRSH